MKKKLFEFLRNSILTILALSMAIGLIETMANIPVKVKVVAVASVILIYAQNYFALEMYRMISWWLRKKLITDHHSYPLLIARQEVDRNVKFLGLVLCRGSTITSKWSFWQTSACKVINFSEKVNTFRK